MNFNKVKKSLNVENVFVGLIFILVVYLAYNTIVNKDDTLKRVLKE